MRFLLQLGEKAASLSVAELYVNAFGNLAKTNNTVVLPANVGDAASMVAQVIMTLKQPFPTMFFPLLKWSKRWSCRRRPFLCFNDWNFKFGHATKLSRKDLW